MCTVMEDKRGRQRFLALIGVSVLLHGAGVWLFGRIPPPPVIEKKRIEIELAWVDTQKNEPEPRPLSPPKASPSKPVSQKQNAASARNEPQKSTQEAEPPRSGPTLDSPMSAGSTLTPSAGFTMQLGGPSEEPSSRGVTVRNGPGEAPDQRSLNEYTGEVLTRKLNTELSQDVGLAAVGVGNVPAHFKYYEQAMRKALPKAEIDKTPMTGGDIAREVVSLLLENGPPSAEAALKVTETPLGRSVVNQNVMVPNVEDQRFREQSLQMLAQGESLKEKIRRARLRAVLEVTTDATGALADVSIVERSGDQRFDESVMHFSRKVARTLPERDDKRLGASMWRTRWQFTWEPPEVRVRLLNAWRVADSPAAQ